MFLIKRAGWEVKHSDQEEEDYLICKYENPSMADVVEPESKHYD